LFDQNLSRPLMGLLAAEYTGSEHVEGAGLLRADDRTLWNYAAGRGRMVVSKDQTSAITLHAVLHLVRPGIPCEGPMTTKTIRQTITFKASPREVYDMIMDSSKHESLSGEMARISKKVGGAFVAWNGHISGINLVLKPGEKIVQAWRATGWWEDHYSIAIFDIQKVPTGTKLKFTQIGVPPHRYSGHYRGWIEAYWTPMKEVFANGGISDKTRARVQTSREQRIRTQRFRRKVSREA
jgi:activator of HSP90 ATPase